MNYARLLAALLAVETGGNDAAIGAAGERGALQIMAAVVEDVNRRHGTYYTHKNMHLRAAAMNVGRLHLQSLVQDYRRKTGREPTMEYLARAWNGGQRGWNRKVTLGYWEKVKRELKKGRVE